MAIKMTSSNYCSIRDAYVKEFVVDTEADVTNLPSCCTGSSAIVVSTANVYMVNASGKWVAFGAEG